MSGRRRCVGYAANELNHTQKLTSLCLVTWCFTRGLIEVKVSENKLKYQSDVGEAINDSCHLPVGWMVTITVLTLVNDMVDSRPERCPSLVLKGCQSPSDRCPLPSLPAPWPEPSALLQNQKEDIISRCLNCVVKCFVISSPSIPWQVGHWLAEGRPCFICTLIYSNIFTSYGYIIFSRRSLFNCLCLVCTSPF